MTLRSSLTTMSMMSRTGALSMARLTGLMASVGSDCHLDWVVGMNDSVRLIRPASFRQATAYTTPRAREVSNIVTRAGGCAPRAREPAAGAACNTFGCGGADRARGELC